MMSKLPFEIGDTFTFSKTIGESDVYLFAGITGDLSPNHVNEEYMKKTVYQKRIAHGVLSLGFASTTSTIVAEKTPMPSVSYGYDHVRFVKPIFIGDTLTVTYTIAAKDEEHDKTIGDIEITNQDGQVCTVAQHILKCFP
jgi:3-hydroxybutyryl-CoA dehydratase